MRKYYFLVVSLIMLVLSIIGFSDNLFTDTGQKSNSDPKFVIHGLFCFAWFIVLVIQTNFIRKSNVQAHRSLGMTGMFAALGVFVTTVYIFAVVYKGWDAMPPHVKVNRYFMASFALLVGLGYMKRSIPAYHKRLIIVASFYMLGPILDRAMDHIVPEMKILEAIGWDAFIIGFWGLFFVSLFAYDWVVLRKFHLVTFLGFIWYGVVWVLSYTV